jgi:hypothetical protein
MFTTLLSADNSPSVPKAVFTIPNTLTDVGTVRLAIVSLLK